MQVVKHINNKNKPVHIDIVTTLWCAKQKDNIALTNKADGVYSEIIKTNNKLYMICEYIESLNLYFVFDTKSFPNNYNSNIISRMNWIRALHPYANKLKIPIITTIEEYNIYLQKDICLLEEYLRTSDDKIKYYPKFIAQLNFRPDDFLTLLDYQSTLPYKTDGWIINCINTIKIYKYKPKNELTIDVLYKNNKWYCHEKELDNICMNNDILTINDMIYRCYWQDDRWIPRESRSDKKIPNPYDIIHMLEECHKNYWTASQLIKYTKDYYYSDIKHNIDPIYVNYLKTQKEIFKDNISHIVTTYDIKSIMDIGCGKGAIAKLCSDIPITGLDVDYMNIYHVKNKYKQSRYKWCWGDINNNFGMNSFVQFDFMQQYDLIIINNVIHVIDNMEQFMDNINKISHLNTVLYLHFLDKDQVKHNMPFVESTVGKLTVEHDTNGYLFTLPWKEKPFYDTIESYQNINGLLINNNWKLICEFTNDILFENKEVDEYFKKHKCIGYMKY